MAIRVRELTFPSVERMGIEIAERKGRGHPDTICDALAERFSVALSKAYLDAFGTLMHHNVDKALLVAGKAEPRFGGGEVLEPADFYMVGRVTTEYKGKKIDVEGIFRETALDFFRENFKHLDPERHLRFHLLVRPGSKDLVELFLRSLEEPLANDTSFGVGYAPLSATERVVFELEQYLNEHLGKRYPWLGEDIKVMGVRTGRHLRVTVAAALVDRYFKDIHDYLEAKETLRREALQFAQDIAPHMEITVDVNAADSPERGSVYITVTGTSAEAGDDGQVGRGNRVNGLITPYRPMSLEAAAGKNPVSHVGKTYNVLAQEIARDILREMEEVVSEVYVYIVSQIGKPVSEPQMVDIMLRTSVELTMGMQERAAQIAERRLEEAPLVWRRITQGKVRLF